MAGLALVESGVKGRRLNLNLTPGVLRCDSEQLDQKGVGPGVWMIIVACIPGQTGVGDWSRINLPFDKINRSLFFGWIIFSHR
jgi:hypothetical protein